MSFSMLPMIVIFQIVALYGATKSVHRGGNISNKQSYQIYAILAALVIWASISSYLGFNGYYQRGSFLSSLPGFWITQIPVLLVVFPTIVSKNVRDTINIIIDTIPLYKIMAFEAVRILALGGIIKAHRGEFSMFFANSIGVLDFMFGATAILASILIYRGRWKQRAAIYINLFGFLLIVPLGVIFINLGLPGPLFIIQETPGLESIFYFPMLLAPTIVVPIFVIVNLFVVIRLIERGYLKRSVISADRNRR